MNKTRFKNGFTIIELLIVIAIIGILSAGTISILNPLTQFQKTRDAKRKSDLSQIQKALETYYQDNGAYPLFNSSSYKIMLNGAVADWGTTSFSPYISTLPKDPIPSKNYVYLTEDNGQTYYLFASLDRADDPQRCKSIVTQKCDKAPANCGATICNYGVSTPNANP